MLRFSALTLKVKQCRSLTRFAPKPPASTQPRDSCKFFAQEAALVPRSPPPFYSQQKAAVCSLERDVPPLPNGLHDVCVCVRWTVQGEFHVRVCETRATIPSSRGHLFKDNKAAPSLLGLYDSVSCTKANGRGPKML